jgi:beta-glucanase (GH16 family)
MNKKITKFLSLSALAGTLLLGSCQPDQVLSPAPCEFPGIDGYSLVWTEDFDGDEIDMDTWSFNIGDGCDRGICGWGNNELQYYTDAPANARVENGNLIITAIKEPTQGYEYSSARMVTKNKRSFQFGRIDVRAKLPIGKGMWPAIWMLSEEDKYGGWPKSGEIDIMELVGDKPSEVFGTVHFGNEFWRYVSAETVITDGTFADDFHTFTLLWRDDCLRFMLDGQEYGNPVTPSVTLPQGYPFNDAFHLILNIAVGGNLPGNPDGTTTFPQTMEVDFIKYYEEI